MPRTTTLPRATALALLAAASAGCIEITKLPPANVRADSTRPSSVEQETSKGEVEARATCGDKSIEIEAAVPARCRSVEIVPTVADRTTERTFTPGGWIGQAGLVLGAGAFAAGGGYLLAEPCSPASAANAPCVEQIQRGSQVAGASSLVVAGLLTTMLVANGLGTIDSTDRAPAEPLRRPGKWAACGWTPAANQRVEVWFHGGFGVGGLTDAQGKARLDLSTLPARAELVDNTIASVRVAGHDAGSVDFRRSDLHRRSVQLREEAAAEVAQAE